MVLKNRLDKIEAWKARRAMNRCRGHRPWRLVYADATLTRLVTVQAWMSQKYLAKAPKVSSRIGLWLPTCPPPHPLTVALGVKDFITFFLSYCRYRDSTTLPPAGDTVFVIDHECCSRKTQSVTRTLQ